MSCAVPESICPLGKPYELCFVSDIASEGHVCVWQDVT